MSNVECQQIENNIKEKNMKKIILALVVACSTLTIQAQELKKDEVQVTQQKPNKNKKVEFEVNGNCDMCKKRIEKAAYSVKGVKSAIWNADHQDIHLIIDESKCSVLDVQKAIAKVGHDTAGVKATDEQYGAIHGCCQYRTQVTH